MTFPYFSMTFSLVYVLCERDADISTLSLRLLPLLPKNLITTLSRDSHLRSGNERMSHPMRAIRLLLSTLPGVVSTAHRRAASQKHEFSRQSQASHRREDASCLQDTYPAKKDKPPL